MCGTLCSLTLLRAHLARDRCVCFSLGARPRVTLFQKAVPASQAMEGGAATFHHAKMLQLLHGTEGVERTKQKVRMGRWGTFHFNSTGQPLQRTCHSSSDNNGICVNNLGTDEQ